MTIVRANYQPLITNHLYGLSSYRRSKIKKKILLIGQKLSSKEKILSYKYQRNLIRNWGFYVY